MKRIIRQSVHFLVYTNLWVALCLSVLVLGVAKHYSITDCWLFATFSFLGTFATYNFHRLVRNIQFEKQQLVTERNNWQNSRKSLLLVVSMLAAASAGILFFSLPVTLLSLLLLGVSGIIVLFYVLPFPGGFRALRSFPFVKNYLILLVWVVLVCVPLINREKEIYWPEILSIALFTFAQIIPFDIRDLPYDSPGMKTIPQLAGKRNARIITSLLIAAAIGVLLLVNPFHWLLLVTAGFSLYGCWVPVNNTNGTFLELVWDGSLLLLGVYFYLVC